jgi:hypothetical protein
MADDRKPQGESKQQNEGEGSRSADKAYRQGVERFTKSGKVDEKAREARRAVEGDEANELANAEAVGKSHSKGEDPHGKK